MLTFFWWRSMPAHDEWMTLLIALTLLLSLYAGFASWWRLRAMTRPETPPRGRIAMAIGLAVILPPALAAFLFFVWASKTLIADYVPESLFERALLTIGLSLPLLLNVAALHAAVSVLSDPTTSGSVWSGWIKRPLAILIAAVIVAISWLRTEAGFDHYAMKAIDLYEDLMNGGDPLPRFTGLTFGNGDPMDPQDAQEVAVRDHPWILEIGDLTLSSSGDLLERLNGQNPNADPRLIFRESERNCLSIEEARETTHAAVNAALRLEIWLVCTWPNLIGRSTLARTDLRGVEIVPGTANISARDVARRRFRAEWCARKGLEQRVCGDLYTVAEPAPRFIWPNRYSWCAENQYAKAPRPAPSDADLSDPADAAPSATADIPSSPLTRQATADCRDHFKRLDDDFATEWQQERNSTLAQLERRDLRNRDLRGADMALSNLTSVDLRGARMEGADLSGAHLEGADLSGARMGEAVLIRTRMEGAVLREARMERAVLRAARLEGTDLSGARMEGVDFREARMDRAVLIGVRMVGADLWDVRLEGADLRGAQLQYVEWSGAHLPRSLAHSADFRGAKELFQVTLKDVIGDEHTQLPSHLHVWTCWIEPPPGIDAMAKRFDSYRPFSAEDFKSDWLCPEGTEGTEPQPTGPQ